MRKCKVCKTKYEPVRQMQTTCDSFDCKVAYAEKAAAKSKAARERRERKERKERLSEMDGIPKLIAVAQRHFNAFIRARDRDKGCFVCDKPFPLGRVGGDFDAGHVRSRGAAGHLRFNEDNCHGECKECNCSWGAKPHEIEEGAIRRIGQARYDALKNDNSSHKWTREELQGIIETYKRKLKELK